MKILNKIKKMIFILFLIVVLFLIFFYFWASSGTIPFDELSRQKSYPEFISQIRVQKSKYKVMTYNIGYLSGMANNLPKRMGKDFFQDNLNKLVTIINLEKPDIIAFQEIDYHSNRSHYIDQLETIALRSHFPFAVRAINWDKRYVPFPYWPLSAHFGRMLSGQSVVSQYPLLSAQRIVLEKPADKPFYYQAFYLDRLIQIVKIKMGSKIMVILNVHLEAFEQSTRENQARAVLEVYRSFKDQFPVLLIGDFNSVPPQATKKNGFSDEPKTDFSNDKTIDIFMEESSLKEAMLSSPENIQETESFTFPSDKPSRKIDYIFYNHHKIESLNAYVINLACSDHLPIIMEFSFKERK